MRAGSGEEPPGPAATHGESALIVPVLAVAGLLAPWRAELDPVAAQGVPPHVTVLYPFLDPGEITPAVFGELAGLFADVPAFPFELTRVGWFDDRVVYLVPQPAEPFFALTDRVVARWPDHPPYAGRHEQHIAHVTFGNGGRLERLQEAALAVASALPVSTRAQEVRLVAHRGPATPWETLAAFPLRSLQAGRRTPPR